MRKKNRQGVGSKPSKTKAATSELASDPTGERNQEDRMLPETTVVESHNLPEMDMLEENTCIRCNGIGEMLVCREIGCLIAVHEECMFWKPTFDDNGDFYCPYCSYKRARSRALQLKKKAALAKKALVSFLANEVALGDNHRREGKDGETVGRGQDQHKECEENERGEAGQDENEKGEDDEMTDGYRHEENENIQGQEETSVGCAVEEETAADRIFDTTKVRGPNKSNRMMEDNAQLKQKAQQSCKVASKKNTPDVEDVFGLKMRAKFKDRKGLNTRYVDLPRRSPRQQNKSAGKSGRSHEKVAASRKLRYREPVKRLENWALPGAKRKRLHWTPEEEEMLKEGVQKYSSETNNLPWRKILDFGRHVFDATRTPVDLKDKWRNLMAKRTFK